MHLDKLVELAFPVDTVYQAWVSSDTVIAPATSMDVLAEVGGHYRLIMETPEFTGRNEGRFLLVDPGKRVTYTWEWNGDGEVTTIDVQFTATPKGTNIVLHHTGFTSQDSLNNHDTGWDSYMEGFSAYLSGL